MTTFRAVPLEMISAPNYFSAISDNRWTVVSSNAQSFWFQLQIVDNLGTRRYIPAVGASMEVLFERMDSLTLNQFFPASNIPTPQLSTSPQSIAKLATANASDRSLHSFQVTQADAASIVSGSLLFKLTESGVTQTWKQNWVIYKKPTGNGC